MDLNRVTLIGRVTRKSQTVKSGRTTFVVATTRRWQEGAGKVVKEAVDRHAVVASGKLGAVVAEYVTEGGKVYVEGRLVPGGKAAAIVAENVILLSAKKE